MNVVKTIEEVKYNSRYWWDVTLNPYSTISNGLADCTCFCYGACLAAALPVPHPYTGTYGAKNWHLHLINGWTSVPYKEYKNNIKVGDIIEWERGNHVAIVSGVDKGIMISGSFYTGIHGKSVVDGKYDTRDGIKSLKELNDFMISNYQYRFFHYTTVETESSWCGYEPDYVLVSPMSITPVDKDANKNQIYVGVTGLRVRTQPNTNSQIMGTAAVGYYNVLEIVDGGSYGEGTKWYHVGDYYLAGVSGVTYYPKDEVAPTDEMVALIKKMTEAFESVKNERDEYKDMVERIRQIVC